jgi:protocatechuate 3,4-dioxygenase beta subunit
MSQHEARSVGDMSRREVLSVFGVAGVALLVGYRDANGVTRIITPNSPVDCIVTPSQTAGPYFVDEGLKRRDIRMDPTTARMSDGLPLTLRLHVARIGGSACTPLAGALVDVWQCDALGVYSDVQDANGFFDTRGRKFLRGYQETDRHGVAEFLTVYPGWYQGRTVHIHFKVRVPGSGGRAEEFTSQLYFDDAITDAVHAEPPYRAKGRRDQRNAQDGIFRQRGSGSQLMLRLTKQPDGYLGEFAVGLRSA